MLIDVLKELAANPVFAGVAGGAGFSALLYQARAMPARIGAAIRRSATITLTMRGDEAIFDDTALFLSRTPSVRGARALAMTEHYDHAREKWDWSVTFGLGWHLVRSDGRLFILHRHRGGDAAGGSLLANPKAQDSMTITCFGRSQQPLRDLVERAKGVHENDGTIRVYLWHMGGFMLVDRKRKRDLSTIFVPQATKDMLVNDLAAFMARREEYARRGTPWRRGYLFEGPPGTGKSSLIFALASHLGRPVFVINLANVGGDNGLQSAFNVAGGKGIVVIEDADTVRITNSREEAPPPQAATTVPGLPEQQHLTLSGLLNAIDGVAAREGRILFVTSNHSDRLDAALMRPGRIDVRALIGEIHAPEARAMAEAFRPGFDERWFAETILPRLPMAPAALQGILLGVDVVAPANDVREAA